MVAPHEPSEVDVLAQGGRSLPSLPEPVRRLLLSLLVVAVVAGWLVDQRLRDSEAARLDVCAAQALRAVDGALGPVRAMSEYVRPTLGGTRPGELRRGLYAMVRDRAVRTDALAAALVSCREVPVLVVHDEHRTRRAGCELLVRSTIDYLDLVARDGREAFRSSPRTAGSEAACTGRSGR